jgi:hypothetical protein
METFGVTPTPGQVLGYQMGLEGLPLEDIERAVARALRERKFMPKPSELRELAGEMTPETRAVIAWSAVKRAVHSVGAYGCPDFDDPVVNATVRNMGGWVELCGRDADTFETFTRKDFERVYRRLYDVAESLGDRAAPLRGIFDQPAVRIKVGLPPLTQAPQLQAMAGGKS